MRTSLYPPGYSHKHHQNITGSIKIEVSKLSHHLSTRLLPGFISLERCIEDFYIEICASAVFASIPSYTRIPSLDTRTELVETRHKIIIHRNGISIIGFPLLCMYQSSESLPKPLSNLPTVSRKIPKKIFL